MSKLRVLSFAVSIDGYGAGPNQDLKNPLGVRGPDLMDWFFHTRVWQKMHGNDGLLLGAEVLRQLAQTTTVAASHILREVCGHDRSPLGWHRRLLRTPRTRSPSALSGG